eukprot:Lankesteria_metandrocarpae@DN263_c0_g1_i1.p1
MMTLLYWSWSSTDHRFFVSLMIVPLLHCGRLHVALLHIHGVIASCCQGGETRSSLVDDHVVHDATWYLPFVDVLPHFNYGYDTYILNRSHLTYTTQTSGGSYSPVLVNCCIP